MSVVRTCSYSTCFFPILERGFDGDHKPFFLKGRNIPERKQARIKGELPNLCVFAILAVLSLPLHFGSDSNA